MRGDGDYCSLHTAACRLKPVRSRMLQDNGVYNPLQQPVALDW
jgi:hypothetical protein